MEKDIFYTAIDLGTSKTATVVARVGSEGDLKVVGVGMVPSQGIRQGRIINMNEAREAVKASCDEARRYVGRRHITWAYMSISGDHISCINTEGHIVGSKDNGTLTLQDMRRLIQSSYPDLKQSAEVLHVIPITYEVDGLKGVRNPVGLHAEHVSVESHIVLADSPVVRNLVSAARDCNLEVRSLVAQSLASAEAVLSHYEREIGVVLVDIGAGTIDMTIFRGGNPWYSAVIPVGGTQMTRDLSVAIEVSPVEAEALKIRWGHASPHGMMLKEEVQVSSYDASSSRTINRQEICQPLCDRLEEMIHLVMLQVSLSGLRRMPSGGIVLTGGCAAMPGLAEKATEIMAAPVRVASPERVVGLPSALADPEFSATIGTLLWSIRYQGQQRLYVNGHRNFWNYRSLFHRMKGNGRGTTDHEISLARRNI